MEHTKKFVLVDPRFVRPSMRDKVLSGLDTDISNILNSDDSDEIKAKSYIAALARFRNYSFPPKPEEVKTLPAPIVPTAPAVPTTAPTTAPTVPFKTVSPLKRPRKRVKVESLDVASSLDPSLWRRTQRLRTKKKFGPQWIDFSNKSQKKKKSRTNWIES